MLRKPIRMDCFFALNISRERNKSNLYYIITQYNLQRHLRINNNIKQMHKHLHEHKLIDIQHVKHARFDYHKNE